MVNLNGSLNRSSKEPRGFESHRLRLLKSINMSTDKNITIAESLARKMNTVAHKWEHADIVRNDVLSMANDLGLDDNDKQ